MTDLARHLDIDSGISRSPFGRLLGLELVSADSDRGVLSMKARMRPEFERSAGSGQWHGGPIAAIVDTVGDYALVMGLRKAVPTINFRVDYLRPAINTSLLAVAQIRRQGRSVAVVDVDIFDDSKRLVAVGRGTYATRSD